MTDLVFLRYSLQTFDLLLLCLEIDLNVLELLLKMADQTFLFRQGQGQLLNLTLIFLRGRFRCCEVVL